MIESIGSIAALSKGRGLESLTESTTTTTGILGGLPVQTPGMVDGQSFASVMTDLATTAANNLKTAEQASFDGMTGKAPLREVVDAVMAAEQSLQTAIAFRDKVVNAYLEITKMQI